MYYPYRSTTDKLAEAFQKIQEAGDEIQLPLYWTGGRDWIIVAKKAEPVVAGPFTHTASVPVPSVQM